MLQSVVDEFVDKSPNQILSYAPKNHSSRHFFHARSWVDYTKRASSPSAIHYAAFELRYGIEYLLFELLVLASESLTVKEYLDCLGDPKGDEAETVIAISELHKARRILRNPYRLGFPSPNASVLENRRAIQILGYCFGISSFPRNSRA